MKHHSSFGWEEIMKVGPFPGHQVLETERNLKKWLRINTGTVPGTTENWFTSVLEVHSLAELKEKSGIETSIF